MIPEPEHWTRCNPSTQSCISPTAVELTLLFTSGSLISIGVGLGASSRSEQTKSKQYKIQNVRGF
ncbi:hypothetical protein SLEP1_g34891 [Rubroshorea leprosula]|uniref:Uncharacterized protein n=1 Tax=Rubroshorea leprosula TaxID=152421 RepID=A0AAV5KLG3_9ROSI|nr:hypothetical protein SLEP1_g34891 [Rubroshorea leprosula]